MARSRLSRKFEKRSKETFILTLAGIGLLSFLFLRYGIPFLSDLSFNLGQFTRSEEKAKNEEENSFVPVPILNHLPKATNEEVLAITGSSLSDLQVDLYLNGEPVDSTKADENGDFSFEQTLSEGGNIIKVKAFSGKNESGFSESVVVVYKKSAPNLTVESPSDGATVDQSPVEVKGKTDPGTKVTINGFQATINNDNNFSYMLSLNNGENEVKITAQDEAGNKTEKNIKVRYSP